MPDDLYNLPPQNLEAEQIFLGECLIEPRTVLAATTLKAPDFYKAAHGTIFSALLRMHQRGETIDRLTVSDELRNAEEALKGVGGISFISSLVTLAPTAASWKAHEQLIKNAALLRRVARSCTDTLLEVYKGGRAEEIISGAVGELTGIRQDMPAGIRAYREIVLETYEAISRRSSMTGEISGMPTGLADLDLLTDGFQPTDLIIIAGRPSMGKTSMLFGEGILKQLRAPGTPWV